MSGWRVSTGHCPGAGPTHWTFYTHTGNTGDTSDSGQSRGRGAANTCTQRPPRVQGSIVVLQVHLERRGCVKLEIAICTGIIRGLDFIKLVCLDVSVDVTGHWTVVWVLMLAADCLHYSQPLSCVPVSILTGHSLGRIRVSLSRPVAAAVPYSGVSGVQDWPVLAHCGVLASVRRTQWTLVDWSSRFQYMGSPWSRSRPSPHIPPLSVSPVSTQCPVWPGPPVCSTESTGPAWPRAPGRATAQCPVPAVRGPNVSVQREKILKMVFYSVFGMSRRCLFPCSIPPVWPSARLTSVQCCVFSPGLVTPVWAAWPAAQPGLDTARGALCSLLSSPRNIHTITHPRTRKKTQKCVPMTSGREKVLQSIRGSWGIIFARVWGAEL